MLVVNMFFACLIKFNKNRLLESVYTTAAFTAAWLKTVWARVSDLRTSAAQVCRKCSSRCLLLITFDAAKIFLSSDLLPA